MLNTKAVFSGFSVDNLAKAKVFYTKTLGLTLDNEEMGLTFKLPGGGKVFVYEKENHQAATFTILNFVVSNIDEAVDALMKLGVSFEKYDGFHQDEKGIARGIAAKMGPDIAWFKDPSGNILSVIQENG
ncbi:MAG TPA: VOC family protein [Patescibacteria group bacterium]|nr:VOC family protein [Patescibacteria group bacterium]